MDNIRKKKILIFLLGVQICLVGIIGYNLYTYKAPLIDLNITIQDNNTSKPIIHIDNEIQLLNTEKLNTENIKYFGGN